MSRLVLFIREQSCILLLLKYRLQWIYHCYNGKITNEAMKTWQCKHCDLKSRGAHGVRWKNSRKRNVPESVNQPWPIHPKMMLTVILEAAIPNSPERLTTSPVVQDLSAVRTSILIYVAPPIVVRFKYVKLALEYLLVNCCLLLPKSIIFA